MKECANKVCLNNKIKEFCFILLIFCFSFIFFYVIHPLVPYDSDDWGQFAYARNAIPIWHGFNPIKIFPESFMPICADIAGYILYPLCKDIVKSLVIVTALALSIFISVYIYMIYRYVIFIGVKSHIAKGICVIVFLMHFLLFKMNEDAGFIPYLFGAHNVSCVYHYIIPMLLNMSVVISLIIRDSSKDADNCQLFNAFFFLYIYISIFSNLYCSIILASYAAIKLLEGLWSKKSFKELTWFLYIELLFAISLVFEYSGGRRNQFISENQRLDFVGSIKSVGVLLSRFNKMALIAVVISVVGMIIAIKNKELFKDKIKMIIELLCVFIASSIAYLVLQVMTGTTGCWYIAREEVCLGICFYPLLIQLVLVHIIIQRSEKITIIIPLIIYILITNLVCKMNLLMPSTCDCVNEISAYKLAQYSVEQLRLLDDSNCDECVLQIPLHNREDNWPNMYGEADSMVTLLYRYKIISKDMRPMRINATIDVNNEYNIPYEFYLSGMIY